MVNLTEALPYSGLIPKETMPCSICGNATNHEFKQGFVCEDCLEYITDKIEVKEKASNPTLILKKASF